MPAKILNGNSLERLYFEVDAQSPIHTIDRVYPQRERTYLNMHYELEIGMLTTGRIRRHYPDYERDVGAGQVWLCGMWEPHGYTVLKAPCRFLVIVVKPHELLNWRLADGGGLDWHAPFLASPRQRPWTQGAAAKTTAVLMERIPAVNLEPQPRRNIRLRMLVMDLLLELTRDWHPPQERTALVGVHCQQVSRALSMVYETKFRLNVAEVAKQCGLSEPRFDRIFKDYMGMSFAKFAFRHRLTGATRDLVQSDLPIKAIADAWGFIDASHFHRTFTKIYGHSPLKYRKLHQSQSQ